MLFSDYARQWRSSLAGAPAVEVSDYGAVEERDRSYPLLSASSTSAGAAGNRWLAITAGFHGDEKAGPLTLLAHAREILERANDSGVAVRIYPCVNPSGFEGHTRYNASGERPNNDFLRYELTPGTWTGELRPGQSFVGCQPTDSVPKETAALRRELGRHPTPVASLDLHQDAFFHGSLFYAYIFGDREAYRPLLSKSGALVPVLRNSIVDSGHEPGTDVRADEEGFIECHDGSITDHYHRLGTPYTAAIETTTETPADQANAINLIWIRGFIDLVATLRGGKRPRGVQLRTSY